MGYMIVKLKTMDRKGTRNYPLYLVGLQFKRETTKELKYIYTFTYTYTNRDNIVLHVDMGLFMVENKVGDQIE